MARSQPRDRALREAAGEVSPSHGTVELRSESRLRKARPSDPSGTWADSSGAQESCDNGGTTPEDDLPGFVPGGDRNQNAQLIAAVDRIVGLKDQFGVGDVRVHTAGRDVGRYTLEQLALHGQGTFIDPGSPPQLALDGLDTSEFPHFCP